LSISYAKILIKSPKKCPSEKKGKPPRGEGTFFVGHKSLSTTMRYVKIENKEQAEAIDWLEFAKVVTFPIALSITL